MSDTTLANPTQDPGSSDSLPTAEFVQQFTQHQRRLYLFILSQVPRPLEAEEILQETNVVIWRKFRQFELGTNFLAWACQIAKYEVLKYRERRRSDRLLFSDQFLERIAAEAVQNADELERRRAALGQCLGRLRPKDRKLIQERYAPGSSGKNLAKHLQRPANSVYQSLGRIRRTLLECINRRLASEARP